MHNARKTPDKEARQIIKTNILARGFFVLGYFCPVLKEIRVYPRLYLLVQP